MRTEGPFELSERLFSLHLWITDIFGMDFRGFRVGGASPDTSRAVREAALYGLACDVLRRIRRQFPNLAVLFRDGNLDPGIPQRVDIQSFQTTGELLTLKAGFLPSSRDADCNLALLNLRDPLGLENGLIEEMSPAMYIFVASKQAFGRESLTGIIQGASDEEDLVRRLTAAYPIVVRPGPDADYFDVLTSDLETYTLCGFRKRERSPGLQL